MQVSVLSLGSTKKDYLLRRWGLSFLINNHILFDCFHDFSAFNRNCADFGFTINAIDKVILSHDHWDHNGGLGGILKNKKDMTLYLPPALSDKTERLVQDWGGSFVQASTTIPIMQNFYILEPMAAVIRGETIYEQALVEDTGDGLSLIVGCAHPHIIPMVQKAIQHFKKPVQTIFGGLHLMHESEETITACAHQLKELGVQTVAPTHCSGGLAEQVFSICFKERFISVSAGKTYNTYRARDFSDI